MKNQKIRPPGENLEKLYERVFNEIHPEIKNQQIGVLSTVLYLILGTEKAQEICKYFNVESNTSISDDLSISLDIMVILTSDPKIKNMLSNN